MKIEIWSDIVCPWCYIGKRRFEAALARFEHADDVEVTWRSFELDPSAPRERAGDLAGHLAAKYRTSVAQARAMHASMTATAAEAGLDFRFDRARTGNTFDAHRVVHLALHEGGPALQDAVKERLFAAYLTEGEPIGAVETLVDVAAACGLDAGRTRAMLGSEAFAAEVRADEREAAELGITGVPFFVLDRRYGVSGAQPVEVLLESLRAAWGARLLVPAAVGADASAGGACDGDSCAV